MKTLKTLCSLTLLFLLVWIPGQAELVVSDLTGNSVTLQEPAQRIVVLTAGECEILYAIGAGSQIVGRGTYCDYPEEVLSVPEVASGFATNLEQILSLAPDVVVCSTMNQTLEQINALKSAGIAVWESETTDLQSVYETITLLGTLSGHEEEATALVDSMQGVFADLTEKSARLPKKTVYFEVSPLEWGLWAAGNGTFLQEIGSAAGLTNIFSDIEGWGEISQEQILARNPDIIVTTTSADMIGRDPVEEIASRSGWETVAAVAQKSIFTGDSDACTRPGPRLCEAAQALWAFLSEE